MPFTVLWVSPCVPYLARPPAGPGPWLQQIAASLFSTQDPVQGWAHKRLLQLLTELPSQGFSTVPRCLESQKRCIMLVPEKHVWNLRLFSLGEKIRAMGDICILWQIDCQNILGSSTSPVSMPVVMWFCSSSCQEVDPTSLAFNLAWLCGLLWPWGWGRRERAPVMTQGLQVHMFSEDIGVERRAPTLWSSSASNWWGC